MNDLVAESGIRNVAIVDDDVREAEVTSITLEDAGFTPVIIRNGFQTEAQLVAAVKSLAQAAICDHRLRHHGGFPFDGASIVSKLFLERVPALLVSVFIGQDSAVSIRKWRKYIPVVLPRAKNDCEHIIAGLADCIREIRGEHSPEREPWRSLLRVLELRNEGGEKVVDVIVPSWNPKEAVTFPVSLISEGIRPRVTIDTRLVAMVNVGAQKAEDLFFDQINLANEPVPEDDLA